MAPDLVSGEAPVRLLVSDVDGTLVRHDKSLAEATVAAARRLLHAGVPMTLISARPPSGILPLAERLGLDAPLGAFNGGTLVASDGRILAACRLSTAASRRAATMFHDAGITCWAFADGRWYSDDLANAHTDRERKSAMIEPVPVTAFEELHGRIDKLVGVSDDEPLLKRLEAEVRAALAGEAEVSRSQTYYCDVTHPRANKGDGIAALADAIGVALAETAAIGDMPNDIAMLRRAGLAIAMGQAPDEVKAVADAVSTSNEEDGVAHAIDHILLPRITRHRL